MQASFQAPWKAEQYDIQATGTPPRPFLSMEKKNTILVPEQALCVKVSPTTSSLIALPHAPAPA